MKKSPHHDKQFNFEKHWGYNYTLQLFGKVVKLMILLISKILDDLDYPNNRQNRNLEQIFERWSLRAKERRIGANSCQKYEDLI
ncbi:hypothetical protein MTR_2g070290 [Medicago truncatula]|uniref:Uncharacterized protein n=1 Tax=Medicago truncatula TaxID=3880 RepID=A0A072V9Y2_MEDTR|nr:hypothetical protein MTR_2g070290 [Medicago truncatula]